MSTIKMIVTLFSCSTAACLRGSGCTSCTVAPPPLPCRASPAMPSGKPTPTCFDPIHTSFHSNRSSPLSIGASGLLTGSCLTCLVACVCGGMQGSVRAWGAAVAVEARRWQQRPHVDRWALHLDGGQSMLQIRGGRWGGGGGISGWDGSYMLCVTETCLVCCGWRDPFLCVFSVKLVLCVGICGR